LSHGQTQSNQRTASVAQSSAKPQVYVAGVDYWAGCVGVLLNKDQPCIRFDRSYLTEIVVDHTPGPNILLGRDVERNPVPPRFSMQHGVTEYTHEELEEMKRWQIDKSMRDFKMPMTSKQI
jgi:hypothetical protein